MAEDSESLQKIARWAGASGKERGGMEVGGEASERRVCGRRASEVAAGCVGRRTAAGALRTAAKRQAWLRKISEAAQRTAEGDDGSQKIAVSCGGLARWQKAGEGSKGAHMAWETAREMRRLAKATERSQTRAKTALSCKRLQCGWEHLRKYATSCNAWVKLKRAAEFDGKLQWAAQACDDLRGIAESSACESEICGELRGAAKDSAWWQTLREGKGYDAKDSGVAGRMLREAPTPGKPCQRLREVAGDWDRLAEGGQGVLR